MKYLFSCTFKDGDFYSQTHKDVSQIDKTKSAFFDVKDKDIKQFWLEGERHEYLVDLEDGHFEIDGVPFKMHDEELSNFRLIYFRKNTIQFQGLQTISHDIEFCIGWQTTKNGKNYQQILTIK